MSEDLIYQYYDPGTLVVINPKGDMRTIHTPFRVQCVKAVNNIPLNAWVYVEEVHAGEGNQIFFLVFGRQYPHSHFRLPIRF